MTTYHVKSLPELQRLIRKHNSERQKRVKKAIVSVAKRGRLYIISHTLPIAFRNLERSIHIEVSDDRIAIVADAPHAEAVERGSDPHTPPLKPLIEWVILRGLQGTDNEVKPGRHSRGTTTKRHAEDIASELRSYAEKNPGGVSVIAIAKAIQAKIAARGTKPHWYMREALPEIQELLDREIRMSLEDNAQLRPGLSAAAE